MIFESTIQDVIPRTPSVKSFRIGLPQAVEFKAGQFMEITIRVDGKEEKKYFTISSSPTQKGFIEFTKRITPSRFSQALDRIAPGDWVKVSLPLGIFTLERGGPKIAFLSGGIGITPIHSMCRFAADQKMVQDIVLLYGNHTQDDIPFRQELADIQNSWGHLRVVHILDDPAEGWSGHSGYISREIIAGEIPDFDERVFFVCGPQGMVSALTRILQDEMHIAQDRIVVENFAGY